MIVAGSSDSMAGEVRVYQVEDGKQLVAVPFSTGIFAVAFHPSGEFIAVGGFDGFVRLIRVPQGEIVKEFLPMPVTVSSQTPAAQ
jgi:WD40 repeat protein